jgi:hypothetical protein
MILRARASAPRTLGGACALAATVGLGLTACGNGYYGDDYGYGAPPAGDAIMQWTIAGGTDPAACDQLGATTFDVTLYDSSGQLAGQWVQDCTAFATTVEGLWADTYTGQADLLDANGRARTTSIDMVPFTVEPDSTVTVSLDFPADSFF